MQYIKSLAISMSLLVVLFAASCTPEEVKTNTELLTEVEWDFQSLTTTNVDPDLRDLFEALLGIAQYKYNSDGTYNITYDGNAFDPSSGTWKFNEDETAIIEDAGTADSDTLSIISLSEGTLTYSFTDSTGTVNVTWAHVE